MSATDTIFYIVILIMSVVIHEVSHGFMAERFGDPTARDAGRLTLNPIAHLDIFGSILLPMTLILSHLPPFGWAKPVPYNPNNLSDRKWGTIAVAAAGVASNFLIAIIFGIIIRLSIGASLPDGFYAITSIIVIVNIALGLFNLIPVAPLDGSKIFLSFLPRSWHEFSTFYESYSVILLLVFIFFLRNSLYPILAFLFHLITGLSLPA